MPRLMVGLFLFCLMTVAVNGQSVNVEREYKINVPIEHVDELWQFLHDQYANRELFPHEPGDFTARFSEERFIDRYFDTPDLKLLSMYSGVRHRKRFVPGNPDDRRHGRQRIQIKLDRPAEAGMLDRTEVTFNVRTGSTVRERDDQHPLLALVQRDDRPHFRHVMQEAGIDAARLRQILSMDQQRRRLYIDRNGFPFAQFSLDTIESRKWWRTVRYAMIEIALDEAVYTNATSEQQALMDRVQDALKRDLLTAYPHLEVDLVPKYNRTFALLNKKFLMFPLAAGYGWPVEVVLVLVGAATLVGGVATWRVVRMRREAA